MEKLDSYLNETTQNYIESIPESRLKKAVAYALGGTGKRLRPKLMLSLIESHGMDSKPFLKAALALELVHTYSLVHDDLPAMDDDHLRRGQPTTHIQFDEATAILVGDALLSDAFRLIGETSALDAKAQIQMVQILSEKIGSRGMVYGQILDIASEGQAVTSDDLMKINLHKTSHLLEASILFGAITSQRSPLHAYESLARNLGLLYQIQDDLLEVEGNEATTGKSFSDERRGKPTFITLLGLEKTKALNAAYEKAIQESLVTLHLKGTPSAQLMTTILYRTH